MYNMSDWRRPEPGSGRILFPPEVEERESLMGLVFRTASENLHTNVGAILAKAGYPHARTFDLAEEKRERLPALARVLGVDERRLIDLAHPPVERAGRIQILTLQGAHVANYDLLSHRRRIAPTTLRNEPFHRAVWAHGLLPYCPHSLELLIDQCPECGTNLGWYRASGVSACDHNGCDADLLKATPPLLDPSAAAAYRRMAALAAPADPAQVDLRIPDGLRGVNPGIVFELGWRLTSILGQAPTSRRDARRLPTAKIVDILVTADSVIRRWPEYFHEEIRASVARHGAKTAGDQLRRLRHTAGVEAGWTELGAILHETYPGLLITGRMALRSLDSRIITSTDAIKLAGIGAAKFAAIKRSTGLPTVATSGVERNFSDFDVDVVTEFANAKSGSVPAKGVSERLGISYHGIEQLAALGLLEIEAHPALRAFAPGLRVSKRSLKALTDKIAERSDSDCPNGILIRLAIKSIAGEKPWGPIIEAMLDGRIRYALAGDRARLFHRIVLDTSSLSKLTTCEFRRKDFPGFPFSTDMTKRDAEEALNLNPALLPLALKQELGERARVSRVLITDVEMISRERISPAEICARIAPGSRKLPRAIKLSGLRRMGVAGWVRREVDHLLTPIPPP